MSTLGYPSPAVAWQGTDLGRRGAHTSAANLPSGGHAVLGAAAAALQVAPSLVDQRLAQAGGIARPQPFQGQTHDVTGQEGAVL